MDPTELERSLDFWFEDGTIILQAENMLYRVYLGFLASRSAVFRDMFSTPRPADEPLVEGCPVVQLHDTVEDLTRFLKALLPSNPPGPVNTCPALLPSNPPGPVNTCPVSNLSELVSVLRLSDKYDVPALCASMESILAALYPTTLKEWDAGRVLNLAVTRGLHSILPEVLYCVITRDEPSRIAQIQDEEYRTLCSSRDTLSRLTQIGFYVALHTFSVGEDEDSNCANMAACESERARVMRKQLSDDLGVYSRGYDWNDPFDSPELRFSARDDKDTDLCANCLEVAHLEHNEQREWGWHRLPDIFDLGAWEWLLKQDEARTQITE
ncbi:hypothetical protein B0H16DRAFT_1885317 [Mycena metata]|uniref:BTB domain-containing protein n=1 Tax=Mycena metata TaxID=1033252 RepID=A0AAD7JA26_9AGAR|nr:hypothetical protein B0H16DRAFT_1885317 [Mycena metata]